MAKLNTLRFGFSEGEEAHFLPEGARKQLLKWLEEQTGLTLFRYEGGDVEITPYALGIKIHYPHRTEVYLTSVAEAMEAGNEDEFRCRLTKFVEILKVFIEGN